MNENQQLASDAAAKLAELTGVASHDVALVLGSGWLPAVDALGEATAEIDTTDLPGFSAAAVAGHSGKIRSVRAGDRQLLVFLSRTHYYEGKGVEVVVHPVRPAPWGVSLRQQRKVMFDALLYRNHRRLYRERIRRSPRWDYYAITGSLMLGVLFPKVLFVWGVLTARFLLSRLRGTSRSPKHLLEMLVTSIAIPPLAVFWRLVGAFRFRVAFA